MLNIPRTFLRMFSLIFRRNTIYRVEWLFSIFRSILSIWIEVAIWKALLSQNIASAVNTVSPVTTADMVTYLIVAHAIGRLMAVYISFDIENRLRSGDIALDLLKPVGIQYLLLGRSLGETAADFVFRTLPVTIIAAAVWGIQPPQSIFSCIFFICATALGVMLSYAIGYLLGLIGFWIFRTKDMWFLLEVVMRVLGGAFIPYWFLPRWLSNIGKFLPFHLLGYTPVGLYMGKILPGDAVTYFISGTIWVAFLWSLVIVLWKRAVNRLVIQGG